MARRTSSTMQALLGLLMIEPMSGYDLGQMVRASIGHMWSESYGQIYPNLKKLAADGLLGCKTKKQKGRPDRHIYSITKRGREQLARWLVVPPQPEIPRNEMLLKLFFGAHVPIQILVGNVERMVEEHSALLQKLKRVEHDGIDKNPQYPDAPFWRMAARYGQIEMEAHLRWADQTLDELRKMARKQKRPSEVRKEKNRARK
ncbi:MAG: PadR family transcriptional regulator [Candidatus Acidiferrales bacterium]